MDRTISSIVPILMLAGVIIILLSMLRKSSGVWLWTQIYIKSNGTKASATIIDTMNEISSYRVNKVRQYVYTVVLEVNDPTTGTKYKVLGKYMDSFYSVLGIKEQEVPILIHPRNKDIVIIDFRAIARNNKLELKQKQDKDKNRLEQLLKS